MFQRSKLFKPQPSVEVLDDSVAFASRGLQTLTVQYLYGSALVFDQSGILQDRRGQTYTVGRPVPSICARKS